MLSSSSAFLFPPIYRRHHRPSFPLSSFPPWLVCHPVLRPSFPHLSSRRLSSPRPSRSSSRFSSYPYLSCPPRRYHHRRHRHRHPCLSCRRRRRHHRPWKLDEVVTTKLRGGKVKSEDVGNFKR